MSLIAQEERLVGDKAPPTARGSSEFKRTRRRRCYPHIGNVGLNLAFESIGLSIQDEARDSLQRRRYLLASLTGNKNGSKGLMVNRARPTPIRLTTKNTLLLSKASDWKES